MARIFQYDIGTDIILSTCVNLAALESSCIVVQKPSGSQVSWSASSSGAASLGMVYYETTASTDLDEAGTWLASAKVDTGSSGSWTGETAEFEVWSQFTR